MKILCHQIRQLNYTRRAAEIVLDPDSIPPIFKACAGLQNLRQGISIHASVVKKGFESYTSISNSIVSFYTKCDMLGSALNTFQRMTSKDSVSWNAVIHGFLDNGVYNVGLGHFVEGRCFGFQPNVSIFVLVLQTCWKLEAYHQGLCVHGLIIRGGYISNLPIQNSLLCMYARFHDVKYAERLFEEMGEKDVISWSLLVSAYAQSGQAGAALRLFKEIVSLGDNCILDGVMMVGVLQAYGFVANLKQAKTIHCHVIRRGFIADVFVGNSLIDMYSKCSDIDSACLAFDEIFKKNLVTWNTMFTGLINNQQYTGALHLYALMTSTMNMIDMADEVTLVNLLRLSKSMEQLMWCRWVHSAFIRKSIMSNLLASNTLLDAYAKCGRIDLSSKLFERMDQKNLVSWTTMVAGYTHCNMPWDAITTFTDMLSSEERPNTATILSLIEACSMSVCLNQAKTAHSIALRNELPNDLEIATALLDMYGKVGEVGTSRKIFDALVEKNVVSWTAIIGAYGTNGYAKEAVGLFHEMKSATNVKPNRVTMLSVLTACSHGGLVEAGLSCFLYMLEEQSPDPCEEHYSCMIDMLARAGYLESAMEIIESLNNNCGASAWGALLSGCRRSYGCDGIIGRAASQLIDLEPLSSSGYLLAWNALALANNGGVWRGEQKAKLRLAMREKGVKVVSGYSLVHVEQRSHRFLATDHSHPQSRDIYAVVQLLHCWMKSEYEEYLVHFDDS